MGRELTNNTDKEWKKKVDPRFVKKCVDIVDGLRDRRRKANLNQARFWRSFGVTQSAASRYETGSRPRIPNPVAILYLARELGFIDPADLDKLARAVEQADISGDTK